MLDACEAEELQREQLLSAEMLGELVSGILYGADTKPSAEQA
jgi:hypothetical protein